MQMYSWFIKGKDIIGYQPNDTLIEQNNSLEEHFDQVSTNKVIYQD